MRQGSPSCTWASRQTPGLEQSCSKMAHWSLLLRPTATSRSGRGNTQGNTSCFAAREEEEEEEVHIVL